MTRDSDDTKLTELELGKQTIELRPPRTELSMQFNNGNLVEFNNGEPVEFN